MARKKIIVLGAGLLLAAVSAWAHHAFAAEFDVNKPIHFTGVVTKLELVNPHTWIHIDVKGPQPTGAIAERSDLRSRRSSWPVASGATPSAQADYRYSRR